MPKPPPIGLTPLTPNVVITSPTAGTTFIGGSNPGTITVTGTVFLTCEDPGGDCDAGKISSVDVQFGNAAQQPASLVLDSSPAPGTEQSGLWSFTAPPPPRTTHDMPIKVVLTVLEGTRGHQQTVQAEASVTVTIEGGISLTRILEATGLFGGITNPAPPKDFFGVAVDPSDPGWTVQVCQKRTFLSKPNLGVSNETLEWTPILNPTEELGQEVGVSGTVCEKNRKQAWDPKGDVPFLHPFYNDWTFYLALDAPYVSLLARGNEVVDDMEDTIHDPSESAQAAKKYADNFSPPIQVPHLEGLESFIEIEMEQGLVGGADATFFPNEGDRVAVFGRWIVDCGHPNYSTEIHPPLMLVVGRPTDTSNQGTSVTVIGRAFQVSQTFDEGGLLHHFIGELEKSIAASLPLLGAPVRQLEARPKLISPPFTGIHIMLFTVRPPSPRNSPGDTLLLSFHFTVRSGVTVEVSKGIGPDEVKVTVLMNDANYSPAPLPPKQDMTVQISDLPEEAQKAFKEIVDGVTAGTIPGISPVPLPFLPFLPLLLDRGIVTDRYTMPRAQSVHDNENVFTDVVVDQMSGIDSASVDDNQPYPIYGWLTLRWNDTKGKEGKETKEGKEGKEKEASKDRKDNKENAKEKDNPKENAKEKDRDLAGFTGRVHMSSPGGTALSGHGESSLATGQAFIRPEERPDVGGRIFQQPIQE